MSRTHRDEMRRLDHIQARLAREAFNARFAGRIYDPDAPPFPWRQIPRHGCNRRWKAWTKRYWMRQELRKAARADDKILQDMSVLEV
jgi:protocatechuate 3,4-dioxygenase beta subunit